MLIQPISSLGAAYYTWFKHNVAHVVSLELGIVLGDVPYL
jgi:hypothetical protein